MLTFAAACMPAVWTAQCMLISVLGGCREELRLFTVGPWKGCLSVLSLDASPGR